MSRDSKMGVDIPTQLFDPNSAGSIILYILIGITVLLGIYLGIIFRKFSPIVASFLIIVPLIVLGIFIYVFTIVIPNANTQYKVSIHSLQDWIQTQIKNVQKNSNSPAASRQTLSNISQGPPGKQGPQGPQGPAGSTFQWQGPLRNYSQTDLRVERMYGVGPSSVIFLNDMQFTPAQTWYLNNQNQLVSQYNTGGAKECIVANPTNKTVNMNLCSVTNGSQWSYNQNGQLQSQSGQNLCLDLQQNDVLQGSGLIINNQQSKNGEIKNKYQLVLNKCDSSKSSQVWAFY